MFISIKIHIFFYHVVSEGSRLKSETPLTKTPKINMRFPLFVAVYAVAHHIRTAFGTCFSGEMNRLRLLVRGAPP